MKKLTTTALEAVTRLDAISASQLESGLYLYCVEVDDQVFYSDSEITQNLREMDNEKPVELVFYSENELIAAAVAEAHGFVGNWIQALPDLANGFYSGQASMETLAQLAEALAWLQELSTKLTKRGHDLAGWPERLRDAARALLRVTEDNRAADQGDFLLYELLGTLEGLQQRLGQIEITGGVK